MLYLITINLWKKSCFQIFVVILMATTFNHAFAQDHLNRATKLFFMKNYYNAIDEFKLALQQHPDNPQIYYNIGACYDRLGEVQSAYNFYRRALKLQPNFKQAEQAISKLRFNNKSKLATELQSIKQKADNAVKAKNYDEAIKYYNEAIKIDTQNFTVYFNLAFCYEQQENYPKAISLYQHALSLNQTSQKTKNVIDKLQKILNAEKISELKYQFEFEFGENNFLVALKKINKILAIDPNNDWALTNRKLTNEKIQQQTTTSVFQPDTSIKAGLVSANVAGSENTIIENEDSFNTILYLILGAIIIFSAVIVSFRIKNKRKTPIAEDLPPKGVHRLLQDYYSSKTTGVLSVVSSAQDGENIQGEVRVLNGDIVNVHTNNIEGVPALHQLLKLELPNHLEFNKVPVSPDGNINGATSTLLIEWTLDKMKRM